MINLKKLCVALWLLAGILFACESCHGQVFLVKADVQSCSAVDCRIESGVSSSVCVGQIEDRWYFVTAGHTFYSSRPGVLRSKILSAHVAIDEKWAPARVEYFDPAMANADIGILSVERRTKLRALAIAERAPEVGANVVIGGFPSGSPYAEVRGAVLPTSARDSKTDFCISTAVVRGVSGGPVLYGGKVAGIVSASDFSSGTWIIGPEKIRQRLVKHLGRLPDCGRPVIPPPRESDLPTQTTPGAPAPVEPPSSATRDETSSGAGASSPFDWLQLWSIVAPALGFGGPIGAGIGAAGWLIARRLGPRVVRRIQSRHSHEGDSHENTNDHDDAVSVSAPLRIPVPIAHTVAATQNRFVEVPVTNKEAEALKEAMRLEAEFTRNDNPQVAMHLRRVQEMADLILQGKKIEKPGWKTD